VARFLSNWPGLPTESNWSMGSAKENMALMQVPDDAWNAEVVRLW
jgi:hypothetical protein